VRRFGLAAVGTPSLRSSGGGSDDEARIDIRGMFSGNAVPNRFSRASKDGLVVKEV
jgi:hypothetical protein